MRVAYSHHGTCVDGSESMIGRGADIWRYRSTLHRALQQLVRQREYEVCTVQYIVLHRARPEPSCSSPVPEPWESFYFRFLEARRSPALRTSSPVSTGRLGPLRSRAWERYWTFVFFVGTERKGRGVNVSRRIVFGIGLGLETKKQSRFVVK